VVAYPMFLEKNLFRSHLSADVCDSRVEVKLVCNLEQAHESNYISG
jgi:hypothetical protein